MKKHEYAAVLSEEAAAELMDGDSIEEFLISYDRIVKICERVLPPIIIHGVPKYEQEEFIKLMEQDFPNRRICFR